MRRIKTDTLTKHSDYSERQYICNMSKYKKSAKQAQKQYADEYNELMSTNSIKFANFQEWSEKGDEIVKFTMYDQYTPVKTSSGSGEII